MQRRMQRQGKANEEFESIKVAADAGVEDIDPLNEPNGLDENKSLSMVDRVLRSCGIAEVEFNETTDDLEKQEAIYQDDMKGLVAMQAKVYRAHGTDSITIWHDLVRCSQPATQALDLCFLETLVDTDEAEAHQINLWSRWRRARLSNEELVTVYDANVFGFLIDLHVPKWRRESMHTAETFPETWVSKQDKI